MPQHLLRSLVIACVGALVAASIDGVVGLVASGNRFASPSTAVVAVAAVALLAFLVTLAVRWLVLAPIFRHADAEALSVAGAMAVVALIVAYDVGARHTGIVRLLAWGLDVVLAVATAIGWYAIATNDHERARSSLARVTGRALAFVMPLSLVAAWVIFGPINDVTSIGAVITLVVLAVAVGATLLVVQLASSRAWSVAAIAVFGVLVAFGLAEGVSLRDGNPGAVTAAHARGAGKVQHVIFLTVDTLRRDALSCYGSTTVRTPNIDRIAAHGSLFRRATSSSSWTIPAFATMMTGLPAYGHGMVDAETVLPDTVVTLAERFRAAGYQTAAIVANGFLAPHRGFAQGFDRYDLRNVRLNPVSVGDAMVARFERHPIEEKTATRDVTGLAIDWASRHRDEDFFLWVHYLDPHLPYEPPKEYVERMNLHDTLGYALGINSMVRPTNDLFGTPGERAWVRSLYEGEVRYVDAQIGRLLAALEKQGIYDDALLVFGVDHGEEFWDHDGFEHGHELYEELIGVPLIIKTPRQATARVSNDEVSLCDIAPTVLDLCGLAPVETPEGVSLAPYLDGRSAVAADPKRPLFSGATLFRSNWQSVTFGGWKYIRSTTTGQEMLFRLADDPGERTSVAITHPDVVARGRQLLDEHERAMEAFRADHGISNDRLEMDQDELERLRSLGYL